MLARPSKIPAERQGFSWKGALSHVAWGDACPFSHAGIRRLHQACLIGWESSFHKILVSGKDYSAGLP